MTLRPSMRDTVLILALVLTPALALAQSAATPASAPVAPSARAAAADSAAEARVEARIKQLHAQLHITAAQDTQWKEFADVMLENARTIDQAAAQRVDQLPTMNAVEDMQSYEQLAEAHVARLQKLLPAFEALYNTMPPEQKKLADRVFRGTAERRAQAASSK